MIWLIIFLSLILRLIGINQSLWLDEAITATVARDLSLKEIILNYLPFDNSPPLFVFLINTIFSIFPGNDLIDRIPSVIFGLATIFIIYQIGKKLKDEKFGLIVALILATSPLHVYYSQEGRMYALGTFLATSLIFYLISYLKSSQEKFLLGYIISGILILYTHYVLSLMLVVAFVIASLLKKVTKAFLISQIIILTSFIFWIPTFLVQLKLGISGRGTSEIFDEVLGKFEIKTLPLIFEKFVLGRIPVDNNWTLLFIIPPLIFFGFLIIGSIQSKDKDFKKITVPWLILPIILAAVISFKIPVLLFYRVLFVLPAFYLLICLGAFQFRGKIKFLAIILILTVNLISLSLYYMNENLQREQWMKVTSWVEENLKEGDVVLFASGDPSPPYSWYRKNHPEAFGAFKGFYVQDDLEKVKNLTKGKNRVLVFTYLQDITDPQRKLQDWVEESGFRKDSSRSYHGVGELQVYTHE